MTQKICGICGLLGSTDGLVQSRDNRLLRLRADDAINHRAVFEDQHRGNAGDLIPRSRLRVVVNVEFGDAVAAVGFGGQLVDDRADDAARATPRRPEIDECGRAGCVKNFLLKR